MLNPVKIQNKIIVNCIKSNQELKINGLLQQKLYKSIVAAEAAGTTTSSLAATANTVRKQTLFGDKFIFGNHINPSIDKYRQQLRTNKMQLSLNSNLEWAYTIFERMSHMDEVRISYDKVIVIQDKLQEAQESRRRLQHDLLELRRSIQLIRDDLRQTNKINEHYVELVTAECNKLREEDLLVQQFNIAESYERDLFSHLTAAVKTTHQKEKIYTHTVKYWSIIGSILGALVGVIGTAIGYHYRENNYNDNFLHLKNDFTEIRQSLAAKKPESWTDFTVRKSVGIYRYFWPSESIDKPSTKSSSSSSSWYNYLIRK